MQTMKKIVIAAAFVIAALRATALPEITLPDLKDCAYGVPVGSLGPFSIGMDAEKKNETDGLRVMFDGKECKLTTGPAYGETVTAYVNLYFTQKRVTIEKAKEMTLRWVELVERKYGISMVPSINATDKRLEIDYTYGDHIKPDKCRNLIMASTLRISSSVDIDGLFAMSIHSHMAPLVINR